MTNRPPGFQSFRNPVGIMRTLAHLPNFIKLYWRLMGDRRVWFVPKLILVLGLAYCIMPLDLIPLFPFVGLGLLDDIIIFIITTRLFIKLSPRSVVEEHVRLIDEGV